MIFKSTKDKNLNKNLGISQLFSAFTLAEVLITLTTIGVVAAITIPPLINNIQDAQYKTAYKKVYSTAQQALNKANSDNLLVSTVKDDNAGNTQNFLTFMDQFQISKKCISNNNSECWESTGETYASMGYPRQDSVAFVDSSGCAWSTYYSGERQIFVDTNGFKKPNQWGKDRFVFHLIDPAYYTSYSVNGPATQSGTPIIIQPPPDNYAYPCLTNKCGTVGNKDYQTYFGTSWLYK